MCTTFPFAEAFSNGKVGFGGFRTAICTGKVFHIKCRFVRLFRQPVDFLVWLRRLWIAFQTNSRSALKQCFQSNRSARQTRTANHKSIHQRLMIRCTNENLPKVCRNKRTNLPFDFGREWNCANRLFYMSGYRHLYRCCVGK